MADTILTRRALSRATLARQGEKLARFVESDASTFELRLPGKASRPRAAAAR